MTVYAITDNKKGEQGLRLLIFKLGPEQLLDFAMQFAYFLSNK